MQLTPEEIQKIIVYEIIVDCYSEDEENLGWAIFMEDNIEYPFEADYKIKCSNGKNLWKKVSAVNNLTNESNFNGEDFYVEIELDKMLIPVNVLDLKNIEADEESRKTIFIWKSKGSY